jgi:hypothetical protein
MVVVTVIVKLNMMYCIWYGLVAMDIQDVVEIFKYYGYSCRRSDDIVYSGRWEFTKDNIEISVQYGNLTRCFDVFTKNWIIKVMYNIPIIEFIAMYGEFNHDLCFMLSLDVVNNEFKWS